jgi:hypothetical protein
MNQDVFEYIFNLIENDPDYNLRYVKYFIFYFLIILIFRRKIIQHLCRHPPFRQNQTCSLNNPTTVHRLWSLITYE